MSSPEIPVPIVNYLYLIQDRKSPYYDVVEHMLKDMEMRFRNADHSEIIYTISPRRLQNELEEKVKSEKLTNINICRTLLALFIGSELKENEDYYTTTSSHGRRNYHVKVTAKNLILLKNFI